MKPCANCGWSAQPESAGEDRSWRDVARIGSVAEAGYLVALLREAGVGAEARPAESFSAVQGAWQTAYTVSVPADDAPLAARILQAEAKPNFGDLADRVFTDGAAPGDLTSVNPWRMLTVLAIVAAAGAAVAFDSFGGEARGRREAARPAGADRGRVEPLGRMTEALRESGVAFRAEPVVGGPRQRLRFLPETGVWELSTDADRDGRYESHRRFAERQLAPAAIGR